MTSTWIALLLAMPAVGAAGVVLLRSPGAILAWTCAAVAGSAAAAGALAVNVFGHGAARAAADWIHVDALSAWHLLVLHAVFLLASSAAPGYFRAAPHPLTRSGARRFALLWLGCLAAMVCVLVANNLAIAWVGIEATTLVTAFLICTHRGAAALEAMWKYLIICSVGVAFAFVGVLLLAAAGSHLGLGVETLFWTRLTPAAATLDARLVRMAFLFIVVGYGTKAGLAPMHNWLPDAHSQAPAPVSALFSGFLLNTALYGILRVLPLVEAAAGAGWARGILGGFAIVSILLAAALFVCQTDVKRMLAYSSVEHIGLIALGVSVGGAGVFAALFHMLNHSLCKATAFIAAGRLGQACGTHDVAAMSGAARTHRPWGGALVLCLAALAGVAPFGTFLSEFLVLRAAIDAHAVLRAALCLPGLVLVLVGASRHAIAIGWGEPPHGDGTSPAAAASRANRAGMPAALLVGVPLAVALLAGVWMPAWFADALNQAAAAITGGGPTP